METSTLEQHDDHIWLVVKGEAWAIQAIKMPIIYLWRGYMPNCEYNAIDMSDFDYDLYCFRAFLSLLEKENGN
jgi:hypothetical protein